MRRNEIDASSQPVRNLATNPKYEIAGTNSILRTNLVTNPSFETASGTVNTRTNLLTNPSLETLGSTNLTMRTNLATNPAMAATSGVVVPRTNLCINPRGAFTYAGYGTQTLTPNVTVANHPEGFTTANRVVYETGNANPGVLLLNTAEVGVTYFISVWVYHETAPTGGAQAFAQQSITSAPQVAFEQGVWKKYTWIRTSTSTNGIGFRITSQTSGGQFLITGAQVEKANNPLPYFDALTTTTNRCANPSMEATGGGPVNVRTNFAFNPHATNTTDWTNISGTAHNRTVESTIVRSGTTAIRYALTAAGPLGGKSKLSGGVTSGETISWSVWVYPSVTMDMLPYWERTTPSYLGGSGGTAVTCPANTWTQVTGTKTFDGTNADPSGAFGFGAYSGSNNWANGNFFILDESLIEKVQLPALGNFFSGSTGAAGDFTYAWTGTANASSSVQQSVLVPSWNPRWYGSTGGTGVTWRSSGTGMAGGYSLRKKWNTANTGAAQDVGIDIYSNVVEGATYTASIYQRSSVNQALTCFIQWLDAADATISQTSTATNVSTPANVWTRGSVTATAPANAVKARFIFGPYGSAAPMPAGAYIDWDWAMIEESPVLRAYQDGTGAAPGDFTYVWSGTANASTSQQRMVGLSWYTSGNAVNGQSFEWAAGGTQSLKIVPSGDSKDSSCRVPFTLVTGKTYTISAVCRLESAQLGTPDATRARRIYVYHSSPVAGDTVASSAAAPNAAGSTALSVTFTVTDDTQYQSIRLYNGAAAGEGDVWWDNLLIEETDVAKPYFDGGTTPAQDMTIVWSGTANASTSLMRIDLPSGASNSGGRFGMQSSEWSARGTKSLKVIPAYALTSTSTDQFVEFHNMISGSLIANETYTISGTCRTSATLTGTLHASAMRFMLNVNGAVIPITFTSTKSNTPGAARVVGTFTLGAATNVAFLRAMGGTSYGNGDVWWDELCLERGITDGTYFDGSGSSNQNLLSNPSFVTDTSTWGGAGAPVGTISRVTTEYLYGTSSLKVDCSGAAANQGCFLNSNRPAIRNGLTYTASAWVKGEAGKSMAIEIRELDAAFGLIGTTTSGAITATGSWQRISVSRQITTGVWGDMVIRNVNAVAHSFYVDGAMYEQATSASQVWYDTYGDFTYVWSGTANASTSNQQAPQAVTASSGGVGGNSVAFQSSLWKSSGSKSLRVKALHASVDSYSSISGDVGAIRLGMTPGKTYTFSATAYVPGGSAAQVGREIRVYYKNPASGAGYVTTTSAQTALDVNNTRRATVTVTIPSDATEAFVRLYNSHTGSAGLGDVWWDDISVVEGVQPPDYFDGTTAASGDFTYAWTGTAHASTSRQLAPGPSLVNTTGNATKAHYLSTDRPAGYSKFARLAVFQGDAAIGFNPTDCTIPGNTQRTDLLWMRSSRAAFIGMRYRTPDGSGVATGTGVNLPANEWTLVRAFAKPNIGDNAAYGPLISANVLQPGDTLDLGPHMTVEGTYLGDFLDGSKPFSKWDGTVNASTSVGYPPSLYDIAGTPELDMSGTANVIVPLSGGYTGSEARTFYTVYTPLVLPGAGVHVMVTYGAASLTDVPSFSTLQLRVQGASLMQLLNRRTGGQGALISSVPYPVNNVACWGIDNSGYQFAQNNNGSMPIGTQVMDTPHEAIRLHTANANTVHVRTIMYRGFHSPETRAAISRYLGNKYGANVA